MVSIARDDLNETDQRDHFARREHCRQRRDPRGFPRLQELRRRQRSRAASSRPGAIHTRAAVLHLVCKYLVW